MREVGLRLSEVVAQVREQVQLGVTTRELDHLCEEATRARGGVPAFLGSPVGGPPFPGSVCASPKQTVMYGFSDDTSLADGDIISLDFGLSHGGCFADSAFTVGPGSISERTQDLLDVTEQSLYETVSCAVLGARVGDIGHRIQVLCEAEGSGVIREYVGRGIGRNLHEEPSVPSYGKPGTGVLLRAGMCPAIEPMITSGSWKTETLDDGWTV